LKGAAVRNSTTPPKTLLLLLLRKMIQEEVKRVRSLKIGVNTSGKASAQILHPPLGDDSSPSGYNAVGR
jgi:hypothetical protein